MPILAPPPPTAKVVGQVKMTSGAATSAYIPFTEICECLFGEFWIPSYGGSDIISLQLGNSTTTPDTGSTYMTVYTQMSTPGTWAAAANPPASNPTTMLRLGGNNIQTSRHGFFSLGNANFQYHPFNCQSETVTSTTALVGSIGWGAWIPSTAQQALGFRLATPGGQTMAAGTWCTIWGYNPY